MKDGIRRAIFLLAVLLSACADPEAGGPGEAGAGGADAVPSFEVDPGWPREMPDLWIMGSITGVFVDARDHVWVTHIPESLTPEETSAVQDPPIGTCCVPAPVVVEFDPEGNVVQGWGDPATQDISEFPRGNRIQVFDQDGAFRAEKIVAPATRASGSSFVVAFSHDAEQRWLYLADGTNHKVWILRRSDLEIVGEFGRGGRQLGQFLRPHGMSVDSHGNIYVGEASTGRRMQRFTLR